ncbi:MAG: HAD family phosphatase [bacterium]|nr:MAG: HAD family phosphatase [bacterium]
MSKSELNKEKTFAVIFDMDGVIVDSNPYHRIALKKFCEQHGYQLSDEYLKGKIFGRTNADWLGELFQGKLTDIQIRDFEEEKEQLFREIFTPHIKPVKGLIEFLHHLRDHQVPCAIATSAPKSNVDFVLNKIRIAEFFQIIIHGNMIKKSKPHPEIYQKTIEMMRFPPWCNIVFEDSLSGVESASRAGCKVVGITTTHSRQELSHTNMVIDDFEQLSLKELKTLVD